MRNRGDHQTDTDQAAKAFQENVPTPGGPEPSRPTWAWWDYFQRPEIKARQATHHKPCYERADVRARHTMRQRMYRQRLEVKAREHKRCLRREAVRAQSHEASGEPSSPQTAVLTGPTLAY